MMAEYPLVRLLEEAGGGSHARRMHDDRICERERKACQFVAVRGRALRVISVQLTEL